MRPRLLARLTAIVLVVSVAHLLTTTAIEYWRLSAIVEEARQREDVFDRAAEIVQYNHAASGHLYAQPVWTPGTGRAVTDVQTDDSIASADL